MGHLFILQGDLRKLNCDAWLIPRDRRPTLGRRWGGGLPRWPRFPDGWGTSIRTFGWPGWKSEEGPRPWPTVIGTSGQGPEWYVSGALDFLDHALAEVDTIRAGREAPLLALPVVGTGLGGAKTFRGEVIRHLVPRLSTWAESNRADVALVAFTPASLAACIQARGQTGWEELDQEHLSVADELAGHCRQQGLALFLGAGVSQGAGLPSWGELLARLSAKYGMVLDQVADYLDRATILETRGGAEFRAEVCALTDGRHYALSHGLLACLRTREAITQNYDRLFESAWKAVGVEAPSVLPLAPTRSNHWLLKMHGCVSDPSSVVLTRADYLRYCDRRRALAGLVQGTMLTRHLLFCGFSLTDPNFIAIVDEVRKARGENGGCFGTVLMKDPPDFLQTLWGHDLRIVGMKSFRQQEIWLDYLLHCSQDCSRHILDTTFDGLLDQDEKWLRDRLLELHAEAPDGCRSSAAWREFERLLRRLGRTQDASRRWN